MQNIRKVKVRDNLYTFWTMTYLDFKKLEPSKQSSFDKKINEIFELVRTTKEIEHCKNDFFCVASYKNEIAGFIHIVPDDYLNSLDKKKYSTKNMCVDYIAIKPKFQNKGLGASLYAEAFSKLKKGNTVSVSALFTNYYSESAFKKAAQKIGMQQFKENLSGEFTAMFTEKINEISK